MSEDLLCAAKGCSRPALYAVRWNNPRIHKPGRRKVWLACEHHRDSLAAFVRARGFLIDVIAASDLTDEDG